MTIYISPERRAAPHGKFWEKDIYETDYCYDIAYKIKGIFEKNNISAIVADKSKTINVRCEEANRLNVDFYLPIHTNASTNGDKEGTAKGPMIMYIGGKNGKSYKACGQIYNELSKLYPNKRGVVDGSTYIENLKSNAVSAYCEIAFHDNSEDVNFLLSNKTAIANAISKGVGKYFDVEIDTSEIVNTINTEKINAVLERLNDCKDNLTDIYEDIINIMKGGANI